MFRRLPRPLPLYPVFLTAYAVLFLYSTNLDQTSIDQVLPVFVAVVAAMALIQVVLTLILRDAQKAALILGVAAAAFFGYHHLALIVRGTPFNPWGFRAFWAGLFGLAVVLLVFARDRLGQVTRGLNVLVGVLLVVNVLTIIPHELDVDVAQGSHPAPSQSAIPLASLPAGKTRPDIYFFVFDRYGSERSIRLRYGITDNDLYDWLEQRGFYVARNSHPNYHSTSESINSTLNMAFRSDLQSGSLRDHAVGRFLKGLGYTYIHIGSNFGPTQTGDRADRNMGVDRVSDFAAAFYDSTLLPRLVNLVARGPADPARERQHIWTTYDLQAFADVQSTPGPKFVFGHVLLPHPPYIYDRTGRYLTPAESARMTKSEAYHEQLLYLNERIKKIVEPLLALPQDKRPIIILQADEGPYPAAYEKGGRNWDWVNASTEDLRIKYGILNAQSWPGIGDTGLYQSISSVNTFRLLFSKYFGADLPLLPDNAFAPSSSTGHQIEISDRLGPDQ
jgi:hypothetical protein